MATAKDKFKALLSIAIDALFWLGWAFITVKTGDWLERLGPYSTFDKIVVNLGQILGSISVMILILKYTIEDMVSMYRDFRKFISKK
jgi:hypothetical protein